MYIRVYIYVCIYVCVYVYVSICICRYDRLLDRVYVRMSKIIIVHFTTIIIIIMTGVDASFLMFLLLNLSSNSNRTTRAYSMHPLLTSTIAIFYSFISVSISFSSFSWPCSRVCSGGGRVCEGLEGGGEDGR